jgi:hypothetical protein
MVLNQYLIKTGRIFERMYHDVLVQVSGLMNVEEFVDSLIEKIHINQNDCFYVPVNVQKL